MTWIVQTLAEDGRFHTHSEHQRISRAYATYAGLEGVRRLLRGARVVLRSDWLDQPPDTCLF